MAEKQNPDLKKIKELIDMMIADDLVEIEIVDGQSKIHLKRPQQQTITHVPIVTPAMVPSQLAATGQQPQPTEAEDEDLIDITSPIVGTFYTAASPDSEAYIQIGTDVNPESIVCIIEAMKVMNEIKAETSGTIVKIMVSSGEAVEYGQVLFKVKPH